MTKGWLDASKTFEQRAQALLAALTLDEKLAQMNSVTPSIPRLQVGRGGAAQQRRAPRRAEQLGAELAVQALLGASRLGARGTGPERWAQRGGPARSASAST